jgi:DNA repair exonuclease SbcCD ATPase subunit
MQIQKIKIENFKSIYEPLEIDFNDVRGFWKISGSVGAGKTTIGEAIIYGLFGSINGKNNGDLISWGRKHGSVEIWCRSKGRSIYIERELNSYGQSPIYVEVDGEELVFTNKRDAQAQLEQEYYDTSRVTIELLCIISFNNFKSLATLNTSDTKKFLDQVLGFYTLTEYAEECKALRSQNTSSIVTLNQTISNLRSQVEKLEQIANIAIIEGDISTVKAEIKTNQDTYNDEVKSLNNTVSELNKEKLTLTKKQSSVLTLGKSKKKEIDFIEKGTCPTCGAPIDQSQLDEKRKERDVLLEHYNTLTEQIKAIDLQSQTLTKTTSADILAPLVEKINNAKKLLVQLEEQAKRRSINLSEIETISEQIKQHEYAMVGYQTEDSEWDQLYNILSVQVRAKILQSFIPALNKNILKYVQRLHLPYVVQFDSNFKCNISLCGIEKDIPVSSLSTGQLKTVDMVIILGVLGTVIGSNGINILFLDELFSNLDAGLRNEMCSVLRESLQPDSTIFIISHTDLEDKYFDGDIHMKLEVRGEYEKHSMCSINKIKGDQY